MAWRTLLYKYLSKYNRFYTPELIEESVQRILDRLIFIRTCEDREIEPPTLRPLVRQNGAQKNFLRELKTIWRAFDRDYDSRLFLPHLADELDCEPTPFIEVIEGFYASKDGVFEYDLNAIDADVLGAVYEQYLEHLIKKVGRGVEAVSVSNKRKAQGIFYTPKFIVRYIVGNTLRPVLATKSFEEASKIRILDPACGSGSFLVEALDYLERYWKQQGWLIKETTTNRDVSDYATRFRFLTKNLYGVDLDAQAVEIAQLNLLLKALGQKVRLPNLANNIREGNSLISGTEEELSGYFGKNWQEKKPFNWENEFKNIMDSDGFDIVIGNPPYIQSRNITDDAERHYYWDKYATDTNHSDVFSFFVQKSIALLKDKGYLGLVLPATWLQLPSFASMRRILLTSCEIKSIVTFESMKVFESSGIQPLILIAQRMHNPARGNRIEYKTFLESDTNKPKPIGDIAQNICGQTGTINLVVDVTKNMLMNRLSAMPKELPKLVSIVGGLRTGDDAKYIIANKTRADDKPLLRGRNVYRYGYEWGGEYVWYRPDLMKSKQCAAPKEASVFEATEKLILRMIAAGQLIACYDNQQFYLLQDNMLLAKDSEQSIKYILAILNSRLIRFYLSNVSSNIAVTQSMLKQLPIRRLNFSNPLEKRIYHHFMTLADKMLKLNKRLSPIRNTPCNKRDELLQQIEQTDKQIDNLVYDLYGLTEEERQIVK